MDVAHQLEDLLQGVRDCTSEGDGPELTIEAHDARVLMDRKDNSVEAAVKSMFDGPTSRNDGSHHEMEEFFRVMALDSLTPAEMAQGLFDDSVLEDDAAVQENETEDDASQRVLQEKMQTVLDLFRTVSRNGFAYKFARASDMYDVGLVIMTKDNHVVGWSARDVVWT